MKYTKEYVNNNKVAVSTANKEEAIKVLELFMQGGGTWCGYGYKDFAKAISQETPVGIIARYEPKGETNLCHDRDTYWKDHNYEIISAQQFFQDNLIFEAYELY